MQEPIDKSVFERLLEGELSPKDAETLLASLGSDDIDPATAEIVLQQLKRSVDVNSLDPSVIQVLEARLPAILAQPADNRKPVIKMRWSRYAAAATLLLCIAGGAYFLLQQKKSTAPVIVKTNDIKKDVDPGRTGAILTLDNGSSVVLDSLGSGLVATQNGSNAVLVNGRLVYKAGNADAAHVAYNTMTTPKGRQFQLVLPDGTKVWLNAASSVRYPVAFTGNERDVQITGEAYFEVAKNPAKPFRVQINKETTIEVLGTHFNINAYSNEASINTTLLEGMVRVYQGDNKKVLQPGQQARVVNRNLSSATSTQHNIEVFNNVNTDKIVAWKDGVFNFQDASLHEVMRQLERWYDIDVVYEKSVPEMEFVGKMGMDLSLSAVLRGLKNAKVHYIVEGRKLIVTP